MYNSEKIKLSCFREDNSRINDLRINFQMRSCQWFYYIEIYLPVIAIKCILKVICCYFWHLIYTDKQIDMRHILDIKFAFYIFVLRQ